MDAMRKHERRAYNGLLDELERIKGDTEKVLYRINQALIAWQRFKPEQEAPDKQEVE